MTHKLLILQPLNFNKKKVTEVQFGEEKEGEQMKMK